MTTICVAGDGASFSELGKGVFADVMKLRVLEWGDLPGLSSMGPKSNEEGPYERHSQRGGDNTRTEAENGATRARVMECQQAADAGRAKNGLFPEAPKASPLMPDFLGVCCCQATRFVVTYNSSPRKRVYIFKWLFYALFCFANSYPFKDFFANFSRNWLTLACLFLAITTQQGHSYLATCKFTRSFTRPLRLFTAHSQLFYSLFTISYLWLKYIKFYIYTFFNTV